jgi:membrane glycosyltransferase
LATLADVVARENSRTAYGGTLRIVVSMVLEFVFSMLIAPVSAVAVTLFMMGLPFGKTIGWTGQQRDAEGLAFEAAARRLWPQTLIGTVLSAFFWKIAPGTIWYWLPFVAGLAASIPIAMITAHLSLGRALAAAGLCRIPEEAPGEAAPEALAPLLPALFTVCVPASSAAE